MIGFLNTRQAAAFLGGRSVRWLRDHLHEIPHRKLYGSLIFDPVELRRFVEEKAERPAQVNVGEIVDKVMARRGNVRDHRHPYADGAKGRAR